MNALLSAIASFPHAEFEIKVPISVQLFASINESLQCHATPTVAICLNRSVWQNFVADDSLSNAFDPTIKYEDVQEGLLGTLFGMTVVTDAFAFTEVKFTKPDTIICVAVASDGTVRKAICMTVFYPAPSSTSGVVKAPLLTEAELAERMRKADLGIYDEA